MRPPHRIILYSIHQNTEEINRYLFGGRGARRAVPASNTAKRRLCELSYPGFYLACWLLGRVVPESSGFCIFLSCQYFCRAQGRNPEREPQERGESAQLRFAYSLPSLKVPSQTLLPYLSPLWFARLLIWRTILKTSVSICRADREEKVRKEGAHVCGANCAFAPLRPAKDYFGQTGEERTMPTPL